MSQRKVVLATVVLTLEFVALSSFFRVNLPGGIQIDPGYIIFGAALYDIGLYASFVGVTGSVIVAAIFSANMYPFGLIAANIVVGLCGGIFCERTKKWGWMMAAIVLLSVVGYLLKSLIECLIYGFPFVMQIQFNYKMCITNTMLMLLGIFLSAKLSW